jgi:hypothetical protein
MNLNPRWLILVAAGLTLGVLMLAASRSDPPAPTPEGAVAVVELFTSQGCSSCPPADRFLSKLAQDSRYRGKVIPLAFHVDYWNQIGWQDPFSSARWSERQKGYAHAFHSNRIYTPQAVINGRAECVGSQESDVLARVNEALSQQPPARVTLAFEPPAPDAPLRVKASAEVVRAAGSGELELWIALYESGLSTAVQAGENASRTLRNDRVVRRLEKVLALPATAGATKQGEVALGIDKRWKTSEMGVAAFLQDPATGVIYGATARDLAPR